jgi:hypothetical protein
MCSSTLTGCVSRRPRRTSPELRLRNRYLRA